MAQNNRQSVLRFDPQTGKSRVMKWEGNSDNEIAPQMLVETLACVQTTPDDVHATPMASSGFFAAYCVYNPNQLLFITKLDDPSKTIGVETIHISCKSDTFEAGKNHNYAGVIICQYNGKTDWRTANGTHCKSGYVVIQDTDSKDVKKWRGKTDGVVHGAVYRNAFGEVNTTKVIGEGFAIQGGLFKVNSGVFNNPTGSEYHDERKQMSEISMYCVEKVVESWKEAGPRSLGCRNFTVEDLLEDYTG